MYFIGKSDTGRQRATNQDSFHYRRIADNVLLCVLCDGMGGTNGGNIASKLACSTYSSYIEEKLTPYIDDNGICSLTDNDMENIIRDGTLAANDAVYRRARENSELANMGTTLVSFIVCNENIFIANVGDSRMYMFCDGVLTQLTHDHSYVQMLVDMGQITKKQASEHKMRNILTRAVGTDKSLEVDISKIKLSNDVFYMLCSDGLYNYVREPMIKDLLECKIEGYDDDYDEELSIRVSSMIEKANEGGGGDNITVILAKNPTKEIGSL